MENNIITKRGQQGDVYMNLVKLTDNLTETPREDGGVVLAHGQVTGHKHQFRDENVKMLSSNDNSGRRFIVIKERPATLIHEEHLSHTYAPTPDGFGYEVKIGQVWTDENEPIQVQD